MIQKLVNTLNLHDNFHYILKNGSISFLFKIFGVLFGFFIIWIISRFFNEQFYGSFALMQVIMQLLVLVLTLGMQNILVIELNKNIDDHPFHLSFMTKILKLLFFIGIIPSVLSYFLAHFWSDSLFLKSNLENSFKILGIGLIFFMLHEVNLYYFIARKEFIKFGIFMFVFPNVIFILFILVFKNYTPDENQLFLYYVGAFIVSFLVEIGIIFGRKRDFTAMKINNYQILKQSIPMMLNSVTIFLINSVSVLMLGRMVSEAQIGIFNAALKLGLSVLLIISTINIIIAPKIADLYHHQKFVELKNFIHHSTRLILITTLPIALAMIIFRSFFLNLFGSSYTQGSVVLLIITISTFINAASGNVDHILNMTENQRILFAINTVALLISILANYILISKFGINGAAVASLIATVFMNLSALLVIKKKLGYYTLW